VLAELLSPHFEMATHKVPKERDNGYKTQRWQPEAFWHGLDNHPGASQTVKTVTGKNKSTKPRIWNRTGKEKE
jgi:hypothetical protein